METAKLKISDVSLRDAISLADLDNAKAPTCEHYWQAFESVHGESEKIQHALSFMIRLCALRLRDDPSESRFGLAGTDWTDTEFTEVQLGELSKIARSILDAELRARVCDVLWKRCRKPEYARTAARAYVTSAERIALNGHVDAGVRFRRGIELAFTVDKNGELPDEVVEQTREILLRQALPDFVIADAVDHLIATGTLDQRAILDECERRSTGTDKPLTQQRFLDLSFRLATRLKDESEAARFLSLLARCYEAEADAASMAVLKLRLLKLAIQTLRRGPGNATERKRLHRKLIEAQEDLPSEFTPIDAGSVSLTENVENARNRLSGQDKVSSLAHLILASTIQDVERWRENAKHNVRDHPLQNLFAAEKFGSTYKTATSIPATGMANEIPGERLIYSMLIEYDCLMGIVCHGTILPMIAEINYSHCVTMTDVMSYVMRSPYIAPGRHEFFCRGFLAGLQGQFLDALHILMPQVESLIRDLHTERGTIVSGIDKDGHEREFDLNKLLDMPETTELLTDDVATSLRLLFVHQAGPNLRNEICHGMLHAGQFYTPKAVYGWWLIVWMALHPVAEKVLEQAHKARQVDE